MKMTKTLLAVLVLAMAAPVLAQTQEKPQAPARTEEQSAAPVPAQAKPAPKLGHSLDPADVDVLTGKANRTTGANRPVEVLPYGYGGYAGYSRFGAHSIGTSRFGGSQFAPVGGSAQPLFAPIAFGRVGNRSFFVVGNTSSFGAPFFFFSHGHRTRGLGLFPPAGPRFSRFAWRPR